MALRTCTILFLAPCHERMAAKVLLTTEDTQRPSFNGFVFLMNWIKGNLIWILITHWNVTCSENSLTIEYKTVFISSPQINKFHSIPRCCTLCLLFRFKTTQFAVPSPNPGITPGHAHFLWSLFPHRTTVHSIIHSVSICLASNNCNLSLSPSLAAQNQN